MIIKADGIGFEQLNKQIRESSDTSVVIEDVCGQRYIGCGLTGREIEIKGTPGNDLGAFFNGGTITVRGNAQDATGDTMNEGRIIIHGNCGDTTGYGMRGGEIYIKGDAGYRMGIHMKEYRENRPVIVVGGRAGDFAGEYLAGGMIIILGLGTDPSICPAGHYCGTGMHGGVMYLRGDVKPSGLPAQVNISDADAKDKAEIEKYVREYCAHFGADAAAVMGSHFYKLTANTKNPYKQLYTHN